MFLAPCLLRVTRLITTCKQIFCAKPDQIEKALLPFIEDLKNGKRDVQTLYVFLNDYSAEFLKENLPPEIAADLVFFEKYTLLPTKN